MDASKENADKAIEYLKQLLPEESSPRRKFVMEFLQAAVKRLPGIAAIAKDKLRRKKSTDT